MTLAARSLGDSRFPREWAPLAAPTALSLGALLRPPFSERTPIAFSPSCHSEPELPRPRKTLGFWAGRAHCSKSLAKPSSFGATSPHPSRALEPSLV